MCIIVLGFFNRDFRSACSTHLGVSASYFKECEHHKFRNASGMCAQCLTRGTFWPNLNSVKNVFFLFIWLILGILHIVLAKKTFNFNFFEKYGQFKLLIAKKDVKCKIKIGTLQN